MAASAAMAAALFVLGVDLPLLAKLLHASVGVVLCPACWWQWRGHITLLCSKRGKHGRVWFSIEKTVFLTTQ